MMMNIRRTAVKVATVSIVLAMFMAFINMPMAIASSERNVEEARALEAYMNCLAEQKIDIRVAPSQEVLRQLEANCQKPSTDVQLEKQMLAEIEKAKRYSNNSVLKAKGE